MILKLNQKLWNQKLKFCQRLLTQWVFFCPFNILIWLLLNTQPSEEIAAWLESLNNFDQRYIPGQGKFSVLESNVSKTADKFDPISAVDDEFYEYNGGKDKDGECHGNGYLEYDDGSYISGSWIHGVREGHFR